MGITAVAKDMAQLGLPCIPGSWMLECFLKIPIIFKSHCFSGETWKVGGKTTVVSGYEMLQPAMIFLKFKIEVGAMAAPGSQRETAR
jgi:hypothetical protein